MKKHFIMLSTALAAFGMTSCIENDEPSSLEELRQAQAVKLKAEANKENAEADKTKALTPALVAAQEAANAAAQAAAAKAAEEAAQAKIVTLTKQLEYEIAAAKKDADIKENAAQHEVNIAKIQAELILETAKSEENKVVAEKNLATAEAALATAKSTLATAEATAEKNILSANVELLVAAAKLQDPVNGSSLDLTGAYTTLKNAEKAVIDAANTYVEKVEALEVAVGSASRDSITNVVAKISAVLTKEQAIPAQEKAVELAKSNLDLLKKTIAQGDEAAWVKVYEDQQKVIDGIQNDLNTLTYQAKEADLALAEAKNAYEEAKKVLDKELTEFKAKATFYQFKTENEAVKEILAKEFKNNNSVFGADFKYAEGVISNDKEIANENIEAKAKTLISFLNSQVNTEAQTKELNQLVAELEAQTAKYKATYEADKKDFDAAVAAFDKAATAFEWSKETEKSLKFDELKTILENARKTDSPLLKAQEAFTKAYAEWNASEESKKDAAKTTAKNNARTAYNAEINKIAKELNAYYTLRTAFDGFESSLSGKYKVVASDNTTSEAEAKLSKVTGTSTVDAELDEIAKLILTATITSTSGKDNILGSSKPVSYDATKGYGLYVAKASKLMGAAASASYYVDGEDIKKEDLKYSRQIELTADEIKALYNAFDKKVSGYTDFNTSYGSQGVYNYAQLFVADKKKEIANQAELAKMLKDVTDAVKAVKDEIAKKTAAAQLSYSSLQKEVDAIAAAEASKKTIATEKTTLSNSMSDAKALQAQALELSKLVKADAEAYAVYAKYATLTAEQAIQTAEQGLVSAQAELAKAEAELEAYKAGKLTNETAISNAEVAVEKAKLDLATAQEKLDLAKAAYDNVLAAVKKAVAQ